MAFLDLVSISQFVQEFSQMIEKEFVFKHTYLAYLLIAESLHYARIFEKSRNLRIIAITLSIKSSISGFSAYQNET